MAITFNVYVLCTHKICLYEEDMGSIDIYNQSASSVGKVQESGLVTLRLQVGIPPSALSKTIHHHTYEYW